MRRFDPYGAALLLVGGMCLIPFLQPRHMPPLRAFYDEWLAFALGLAALAFMATASRQNTVRVPVPALFLALFAFTLVARTFGHQSAYPQSPLLWGLYLMFAALVLVLGRMLVVQFGRERVCDVLAVCLLAGALANSVFVALQPMGIPLSSSAFVAHLQGMRPTGNLGQANLLANYIALGEASLVYLYARGKLGAHSATASKGDSLGTYQPTGKALCPTRRRTCASVLGRLRSSSS